MNESISIAGTLSDAQGRNLKHIPGTCILLPNENGIDNKRTAGQEADFISKKVTSAAGKSDAELEAFKSIDLASLFDLSEPPSHSGKSFPVGHFVQQTHAKIPSLPRRDLFSRSKHVLIKKLDGNANITLHSASQQDLHRFQNEIHNILEQIRVMQNSLQIIGFTSTHSGEGASTICSSLAAMSAEMQKSLYYDGTKSDSLANKAYSGHHAVLLIDAQIHHPSVHALFGAAQKPGLAELLNGGSISKSIQKVLPHLHIIACGEFNKIFLTQLEWIKFAAFLKQARQYYSHIFIDLPPLIQYPAGIDLARLCQAVALVVEANKTRKQTIRNIQSLLKKNDIPILGGILNKHKVVLPEWLYRYL